MNEDEIVSNLKGNVPQAATEEVKPVPQPVGKVGATDEPMNFGFDELTLYKLHNFFGQTYSDTDTVSIDRVKFIYEQIANRIQNGEYDFVVSAANQMMSKLGIANADDKIYRLYQWLRLDNVKNSVEAEMGALGKYDG